MLWTGFPFRLFKLLDTTTITKIMAISQNKKASKALSARNRDRNFTS
jgi:hypothetical protein